jgi:eukaryotic-like serine/threonine-protein kinase
MGKVWRAHHIALKRDDALKVLPEAFASDPERLARFQREAQVLASLNHPNIARVYGLEESDGTKALVMELVEGPTLADRMAKGPISIDEALATAKQIAEALEAAHEQGIVHRDLKPANIKVRDDGTVKVLDFGLAKALEPSPALRDVSQSPTIASPALMTSVGMLLGTAAYMSPEQARGKAADRRADIWAFGCVLFEMLSGGRAFGGEAVTDTLARIIEREPDWTMLPPTTPPPVRELLRLCLEKDVKNRRRDIGDVRIDIERALTASRENVSVRAVPQPGSRLTWVVPAALLAVAGAMVAMWAFRPAAEGPEMRLQINTPATALPLHFALSPNGRTLVFVAGERPERLWLRRLDLVEPQPLLGTESAQFPFWSGDSGAIGFFASGKLYRVNIGGGTPQVLADAPNPRGGTWNAKGVILFAPVPSGPLMRTAASGGESMPVTMLRPGQIGHRFPQFLPDGRHFLFYCLGSSEQEGIYLGTLDGGEPKRLTASNTAARYLHPNRVAYVREGALVARLLNLDREELTGDAETLTNPVGVDPASNLAGFSVSADARVAYRMNAADQRQLTWYDRTGTVVGTVGEPDTNDLRDPELAPDGWRIALDRTVQGNRDVWLMNSERGAPMRFTFDPAVEAGPIWSPDGTRMVFLSTRRGPSDLYVRPSNGVGGDELLLESPNDKWPYDWSKDGRFLLYREEDPKTGFDLKALALTDSERKSVVVTNTPFEERHGQFSPDGHWVAYATNESGRFEIVVQAFPQPTAKWQVSTGGGFQPRWRGDGRELYFIAPDGMLMAASFRTEGSTVEVDTAMALFRTRFRGGSTTNPAKHQYVVSRDGRFLINQSVEDATPSPITLILNWKPKR